MLPSPNFRMESQLDAFGDVTAYLICEASVRVAQTQHSRCQHAACDQLEQQSAEERAGTGLSNTNKTNLMQRKL